MNLLPTVLLRYLSQLRYPWLFALTASLFVLDLLIPDLLPFADELLLGLTTMLLATRSKERRPEPPEEPPAALDDSSR